MTPIFPFFPDVDAGWKFWKKKKDDNSTTEDPLISSTTASSKATATTASPIANNKATTAKPTPTQKPTLPSANRGIAAAADPALAIGVGNVGGNIKENARTQPRKPAPGTEVGLDIGLPKPKNPGLGGGSGQGYRDWAADLTGAGDSGRLSPKLPDKGPALSAGGQGSFEYHYFFFCKKINILEKADFRL